MVQKEEGRVGRPRAYDPDTALSAAMAVFWDKGFQGTSLDDLSRATTMNRPSLYAAFGDKRAIYAKALAAYKAASRRSLTAAMDAKYSIREALANVYRLALDSYIPKNRTARGCFMIGSALAEAVSDPDVRRGVCEGLAEIEQRFADRFATSRDELANGGDAAALAKIASAALYSMAIQARAGAPRKDLEAIGKAAIDLIAPRSQPRQRR